MVRGIVEKLNSKEVTTRKFGKKPVYSLLINGVWYGNIWKKPDCTEGDEVEFTEREREYDGKTYYDVNGVVNVISRGQGTPSNSSSTPEKPTFKSKRFNCTCDQFPINPLDRQMSIIIQSSVNRAVEIILAQFATMTDAQKKKYDAEAMWADVSLLTDQIAAKASGQDLIEEVLKEKGEKYKEYQKLLQGELDLEEKEEEPPAK